MYEPADEYKKRNNIVKTYTTYYSFRGKMQQDYTDQNYIKFDEFIAFIRLMTNDKYFPDILKT